VEAQQYRLTVYLFPSREHLSYVLEWGTAYPDEVQSCAGGSVATGRANLVEHVEVLETERVPQASLKALIGEARNRILNPVQEINFVICES
jgi:hypothetical protein